MSNPIDVPHEGIISFAALKANPNFKFKVITTAQSYLQHLQQLIAMERRADQEQYREKVTQRSLSQRVKEGTTWYPVRLRRSYIGTGERNIIELERTNYLDQSHSFHSGKTVNIFSNQDGKPEKQHTGGVVNYVRDNLITITINSDDLPDWIDDKLLGIDVMFDEQTYREMDHALKTLAKAEDNRLAVLRDILAGNDSLTRGSSNMRAVEEFRPTEERTGKTIELPEGLLNEPQQHALNVVESNPCVSLIHGPPGTGKTTTLVEAIIRTLLTEKQVLVCAPSNAAIDLLVEKLSERRVSVVRIGHPARVTEGSLSKTLDARIADHPQFSELRRMRKRMEELRNRALKFKRNYGFSEREERRMLLEESRMLRSDADLLEFHIVNDLIQKAEAICCTLTGAAHYVLKGKKFRTVFIDEAGQALEPACWIPMLKGERLVMAGDHCQLPPTVKSREASLAGLSHTLFERCMERFPEAAAMLEVQYRMNAEIMTFPSQWFYNGKLKAHESVATALLRPNDTPMVFIDTAGAGFSELKDPETLSRFNEEEAGLAIKLAEQMAEEIGVEQWLEEGLTMGIITPYSAQVERIKHKAESSGILDPLHKMVSINTVDAFQGQERDIIIISFVRSNDQAEVGFLSDIRRTNVAMTRARKKLIMIGDSATLGAHPFYEKMISHFQERDFYKSCFEV